MACAACVDSLRVVGRCQGDGGCETAATSCNYGHRLVRRQDAPSSRPTPENTPGRTPGMAQADCRNCNGHAACAFHGATPTPSPALGNPYVNADGWEDPALLFAAAAEEVIGIGEDGMTVILEDGRWAIMTIREARFAHERTRQVTTMNCPHACVDCSTCENSEAARDIRTMRSALERIITIMTDRQAFVMMGPRAAAGVESVAREALRAARSGSEDR